MRVFEVNVPFSCGGTAADIYRHDGFSLTVLDSFSSQDVNASGVDEKISSMTLL